ncbi:thiamine-phosphate kinase [Geovibrio thiophilus]|uniref:Thiamine-monophosphate kinase n=1 Tax=Geovibrio thiophilus TaxID=139438 RepID=A0A3R5XVQ4_9BACT|nr:thiamine-phosphate kinase [Geovibrio thiophilus]QAR32284.1 thiamine-phosphate kinase [Geovibrio thiophilus]
MKEFAFIKSLKNLSSADGLHGIGDDAVLTDGLLIAKDIVAEGVHFTKYAPLQNIIFRLFTANVSDIAAMGGQAEKALLGVALPSTLNKEKLTEAVRYACSYYDIKLIGGDTTSSISHFFASLTIIGSPSENILTRNGAKEGDEVYLSRPVGGAAAMLARELAGERVYEHYLYKAETELGEYLGGFGVNSCIDISDGLGRDASHIAEASGVRIELDSRLIPEYGISDAVSSGEEFALLFTVPKSRAKEMEELIHRDLKRPVYRIGKVKKGAGVFMDGEDISEKGWEHG